MLSTSEIQQAIGTRVGATRTVTLARPVMLEAGNLLGELRSLKENNESHLNLFVGDLHLSHDKEIILADTAEGKNTAVNDVSLFHKVTASAGDITLQTEKAGTYSGIWFNEFMENETDAEDYAMTGYFIGHLFAISEPV